MAVCTIVSFRLGGPDGVSIVAASWQRALESIGFEVTTVAGAGARIGWSPASSSPRPPTRPGEVDEALADADLVVVENLCTIPLNLPAARAVADALRGRPAILHHHDPPWQRDGTPTSTSSRPTTPPGATSPSTT